MSVNLGLSRSSNEFNFRTFICARAQRCPICHSQRSVAQYAIHRADTTSIKSCNYLVLKKLWILAVKEQRHKTTETQVSKDKKKVQPFQTGSYLLPAQSCFTHLQNEEVCSFFLLRLLPHSFLLLVCTSILGIVMLLQAWECWIGILYMLVDAAMYRDSRGYYYHWKEVLFY